MTNTLMSLGMFVFSVPTLAYDELQRRTDFRHARNGRIGARDAVQFIGPGEDSITLTGSAHIELSDGPASLDQLRDMGASGEVWPLVDGSGKHYGAFVIEGVDETHKALLPDGTPRMIGFSVQLLLVDADRP